MKIYWSNIDTTLVFSTDRISNDEKSLSIEEMENKALFYLKKIAEIRTDKKFSSLASEFSNLIKKMGKNSS